MAKKKVALVIGHGATDPGAVNTDPTNGMKTKEYDYNFYVVPRLVELLKKSELIEPMLVKRDVSYSQLPAKINALNPNLIIEFHCNASAALTAGGTETLYSGSVKGKPIAATLQTAMLNVFGLKDRGIKALDKDERGATLIFKTNAPCFIVEPFFISNEKEETIAVAKKDAYIKTMATAIEQIVAKGLV